MYQLTLSYLGYYPFRLPKPLGYAEASALADAWRIDHPGSPLVVSVEPSAESAEILRDCGYTV